MNDRISRSARFADDFGDAPLRSKIWATARAAVVAVAWAGVFAVLVVVFEPRSRLVWFPVVLIPWLGFLSDVAGIWGPTRYSSNRPGGAR